MPSEPAVTNRFSMGSAVLGFFVGVVTAAVLGGVAGYSWLLKREADVRRGWNLVPVVVVAQDIPKGQVLTYEMLAQRPIPEQFNTASVVHPADAQKVENRLLLVPVRKGDALLWSQIGEAAAPGSGASTDGK
jgi:pilus assembly protein CpaB